tara:strand:- start:242 stop:520 length:279 start_codon:yes stop_codon:yes gene_type:complete
MIHPDDYTQCEYFSLDQEQKDFIQKLMFYDYLDHHEVARFRKGKIKKELLPLYDTLFIDMILLSKEEDYQSCALFRDVIKRFKNEIVEFDTK